ncbi:GNAT family N-acetyltransferase [Amycolatopsis sp. A133]|uniref:GNAT family N-acetyltransferase n=1 Tax=Amycolatopsis sp. A133 TaxID=3064472 RepID=UPI0027FF4EB2|nr:GNAT family N-acetyltransferase [Amycolatopsis sp. A133]MDQ7809584.1 GNAT family N-acetyltransferase [Amycolatopsis sp. A133]
MRSEIVVPLAIRDLTDADLPECGWSGSRLHLEHVARALVRVRGGEAEYLVACAARSGQPVGKGLIDYRANPGAGTIGQLAVHPVLQSCGIGTALALAAEERIRARGLSHAELGVEVDNPRARELYERLGYTAYGTAPDGWDEEAPDGSVRRYETTCVLMRKPLTRTPATPARPRTAPPARPPSG